ncbi:MAG TPA: TolC family protein [Phycisphaerales bacterium]|nr:TolC family protein [Phycisphaerales bacterium]
MTHVWTTCRAAAALNLLGAGLSGCASYSARPVDLHAHRAAWAERTPESPDVRLLAEELSKASGEPVSLDLADGLSAAEAELVALVYNPELRVARLRAGVARATADNAGRWEDPVLGGEVTRFLQSTANPWMLATTLGLTLPVSGRLGIERQRAGAEHATAITRVFEQEWTVRNELRRAWARWSAAEQKARVTREYLASLEGLVGIVDRLEQAGELPTIDARFFKIEHSMRRNELVQMEAMRREAELMVRQVMGLSPGAPVTLLPGLSPDVDASLSPEHLLERSPALAVAQAEYEVAEKSLELEVRRQYPDLMVGPGYGREEGMDQAIGMFQLPLPLWNRNREGVARAEAEREVARAMLETTLERVESQLAQARVSYEAALARRETLEREIVPLVDEQFAASRRVAELGEVNTLSLLEAVSRQQEVRMALIEAKLEEWLAAIRVSELTGPAAAAHPSGTAKEAQQ